MVKPTGHSKSKTYHNHKKTSTDIPSGYEYVAEQVKRHQKYVRSLNAWNTAVSNQGKSRDRGDDINSPQLYPSDFKGGKPGDTGNKDLYEWMQKQDSQYARKVWEGGPAKYKNPGKRLV